MVAIELLAVAAGLGFLVLLAAISIMGPRDKGGRLPGNVGPMVPYGDDDDGGDASE